MQCNAQKMKFSVKNFFSKCDRIRRKLGIWSHLLKKSLMQKFIFCVVMLALFLLYVFLVWIFCCHDLFQVTGTDASCVLYIICSQFITFEQVTLCSSYCAWFVALLASSYTVLLCTCPCLFLVQFDSSVYIRIQFELY